MKAVIQAGGRGTRLRPYTFILPKPLMPVGEIAVIEMLLKWLRKWGIKKTYITTGYLGHLIRALCNDGCKWDMDINYTEEPEALGTIGPLRLLDGKLDETFIALNGDLITDIDLRDFISFHKEHGGLVTVAVTEKKINIDLGVLESENNLITHFREKPIMSFKVSMGIYCMEPEILHLIPKGVPYGFDDLIYEMLDKKLSVYTYEHKGIWLDIGREEDFKMAQDGFLREYKAQILGC